MSSIGACAAAVAIAIALLGSMRAQAEPAVRLAVTGDCPSAAQVRAALAAWIAVGGEDAGWTIEIARDGGEAALALRDRAGAAVLSRRLASGDCAALAEAFAVMVHGHLVELQLLPAPTPAPATPAPAPAPATPAPAPATPAPAPAIRIARRAAPAPAPAPALAISGGRDVAGERAGFGRLDVAWAPAARWRLRGAIDVAAPVLTEAGAERLDVWRAAVRAGAGARLPAGPVWLQPALGAGLAVRRVDPRDLGGAPPRWRVQPMAEAAAAIGAPLTRRLALRLEAVAALFLVTHRYVVDPDGAIGRSPRAAISLAGGIEWSLW